MPGEGKNDVTESVNTFSYLEPACIATFKTIEEADEHMDTGHHVMTPEKETMYDNVCRKWAAVTTSVKFAGQKIGRTDYVPLAKLRLSKGWALKKQKAAVRISSGVEEFLTNLFNKGAKDPHQKAMPADVVEQIKKTDRTVQYRLSEDTSLGWLRSKRDFQLVKRRVKTKRLRKRITWSN